MCARCSSPNKRTWQSNGWHHWLFGRLDEQKYIDLKMQLTIFLTILLLAVNGCQCFWGLLTGSHGKKILVDVQRTVDASAEPGARHIEMVRTEDRRRHVGNESDEPEAKHIGMGRIQDRNEKGNKNYYSKSGKIKSDEPEARQFPEGNTGRGVEDRDGNSLLSAEDRHWRHPNERIEDRGIGFWYHWVFDFSDQ